MGRGSKVEGVKGTYEGNPNDLLNLEKLQLCSPVYTVHASLFLVIPPRRSCCIDYQQT